MKTHILFSILTVLFLTACASNEGRKVASTQETHQENEEHAKADARSGKDFNAK